MLKEILGDKTYIVKQYINDCINLVKSFIIYSKDEASLYNDYIKFKYPTLVIPDDKREWRYYKHIAGLKHSIDVDIKLISIDTGGQITLTRDTINNHIETKKELLKFGYFYEDLVSKYQEQSLYILASILPSYYTIDELIDLPTFSIIAYNDLLVENFEYNLLHDLSIFIENYKVTWMIPYYGLSDNLFLASQYAIFHLTLVNKLIAIRLKNAKTHQAHSFHIKNYLASHHYLDKYYRLLTPKQIQFLYRNILYLDNHVGRDGIYKLLLERLFEDRKISVFNYTQVQTNTLDLNNDVEYKFDRKYLTTPYAIQEINEFNLDGIESIEGANAIDNQEVWVSDKQAIDFKFKTSPFNKLLTKDIESVIYDYTDNVQIKLLDTIINYWGYLIKTDRTSFNLLVKNDLTNVTSYIANEDVYRLLIISIYYRNSVMITEMPTININSIFREVLPTAKNIIKSFYRFKLEYEEEVNRIISSIPSYKSIINTKQLYDHVLDLYYTEMGLWIYLSNLSSKDDNGQMNKVNDLLHTEQLFDLNTGETIETFVNRIGFKNLSLFTNDELDILISNIINTVFDNKYSNLFEIKNVQKAMVAIFNTLSSYNIQFTNSYTIIAPIIAGIQSTRTTLNILTYTATDIIPYYSNYLDITTSTTYGKFEHNIEMFLDLKNKNKSVVNIDLCSSVISTSDNSGTSFINLPSKVEHNSDIIHEIKVQYKDSFYVQSSNYVPEIIDNDLLTFLLEHPLP